MSKEQWLNFFWKKSRVSFLGGAVATRNSFVSFWILFKQVIHWSFARINNFMFFNYWRKYFVVEDMICAWSFMIKMDVIYKYMTYTIVKINCFEQKIKFSPARRFFFIDAASQQRLCHSKAILILVLTQLNPPVSVFSKSLNDFVRC